MTTAEMQGGGAEISREGPPATLTRHFSWIMLGILTAFMVNNVLTVSFGFPGVSSALGDGGAAAWVQVAVYLAFIGIAALLRRLNPDNGPALGCTADFRLQRLPDPAPVFGQC